MRKFALLCAAILCVCFAASAQDFAAPPAPAAATLASAPAAPLEPAPAPAPLFGAPNRSPWQLGLGYQFSHFDNIGGQSFNNNGVWASITRYVNDWLGIEGDVTAGFGTTPAPSNFVAKTVFAGGGAHMAMVRDSRLEPWIHALVGVEHFRFTQGPVLGSNTGLGYVLGGGADYKLMPRIAIRFGADFLGTRVISANQANYQAGVGVIFNF